MPNPIDNLPPAGSRPAATPFRMMMEDASHTGARIKVVGVGGGGGNAVNRMVREGFDGVQFVVANTDVQALRTNAAPIKVQLGEKLTKGLGAGADPSVGRHAALEDTDKLIQAIDGADLVFVTAGLGGGTGTGGAPVIASLASELGRADHRGRHPAVHVRGAQACEAGRGRPRRAPRLRRQRHHHPERAAAEHD